MKKSITTLLVAVLAATLSTSVPAQQAAGVPKSLRGSEVPELDKVPDDHVYRGRKPGAQKAIARTFRSQPPLIPHAVENFDEITLEENQCLSCHSVEKYKEKKAPRLGNSHFIVRDGKPTQDVSMARHSCVACHVPQSDAPPLVENTFRGDLIPTVAKKK